MHTPTRVNIAMLVLFAAGCAGVDTSRPLVNVPDKLRPTSLAGAA
jgi:hypothetical protein